MKQKINKILTPKSKNEETARREQILNILIFFSTICFSVLSFIYLFNLFVQGPNHKPLAIFLLLMLSLFIFLFWLSKKTMLKTASWLLIIIYSLPMVYSVTTWNTDLPVALLISVLIITFSGVLIGYQASLISASVLSVFLITLTKLQKNGLIAITGSWRLEKHEFCDAIAYAILMMIIAIVIWIFDNGLNKALKRARLSEKALKQERNTLEIKVKERMVQIREMKAEKIGQLYRLAEFGRLSSGVFHDLINPLTAVSLNLEQIKNEGAASLDNAKDCLSQAIVASHKMEDLIACIKKSIRQENHKTNFCLKAEIETVISILAYKARKAKVEISFSGDKNLNIYGDPVKFSQIIINLISNSIDSCESQAKNTLKAVGVNLTKKNNLLIIVVDDCGIGILPENINKIFHPFFSTKNGQGLGLGLSSTKNIIEKEFLGTIGVVSEPHKKTEFTVSLPLSYTS